MQRFLLFILVLFICSTSFAQQGRTVGQSDDRPKIGKLSGIIIDADTDTPLEFTTISIFNRRDSSLVTGGMTNEKGEFNITGIPVGTYRIKVSFIGYRDAVRDSLSINMRTPEVYLGKIKLRLSAQNLQEVTVTGERPVFESAIDRRIFNVEKNLVSLGGSATDVLETIPSISVDQDGGISLRGSGSILVLIDGRPSGLTGADRNAILDQIPASSIERIEVITNPSSKYDAEGVGGIINVILKKNKLAGFNGLATLSAGTRDKYNASLNLNYRTGMWNVFGSYSYRDNNNFNLRDFNQLGTRGDGEQFRRIQETNGSRNRVNHVGRVGFDLSPNARNTIGASASINTDTGTDWSEVWTRDYDNVNVLDSLFLNRSDQTQRGSNYDFNLNYRLTFEQPGREFTALISGSTSTNFDFEALNQQDYANEGIISTNLPFLRQNNNSRANDLYVIQADYVHPMGKLQKWEAGYKSTIRTIDSDQLFETFNHTETQYEKDPNLSNQFIFDEQVHSLYGIYANGHNKLGYQVGLRYEQTNTKANQVTLDSIYRFNYGSLFPSVFLSYKLGEENQLQLNYSRRISRPNIRNLNPFVNATNPQSISFGNPTLRPEFTNSFEFSYLKGWKKLFMTSSIFYRETNDVIQRITRLNETIQETTFANISSRTAYGLEFINRYTPNNQFNTTLTYNFFRTVVDGGNLADVRGNQNISWSANLMSNYTIPNWFDVQVMASYRAPTPTAQGTFNEIYFVNLGLKRNVLKNQGTVSLNISDMFDTREFSVNASGSNFENASRFKRESQIATITFTYKFGKYQERRGRNGRGERGEGEQRGGGDEDFF